MMNSRATRSIHGLYRFPSLSLLVIFQERQKERERDKDLPRLFGAEVVFYCSSTDRHDGSLKIFWLFFWIRRRNLRPSYLVCGFHFCRLQPNDSLPFLPRWLFFSRKKHSLRGFSREKNKSRPCGDFNFFSRLVVKHQGRGNFESILFVLFFHSLIPPTDIHPSSRKWQV